MVGSEKGDILMDAYERQKGGPFKLIEENSWIRRGGKPEDPTTSPNSYIYKIWGTMGPSQKHSWPPLAYFVSSTHSGK